MITRLCRCTCLFISQVRLLFLGVFSIGKMDYNTARDNLIKLLCVNVEQLADEQLRKLVKKRYKAWHPDKNVDNPERYIENFKLLNESYNVFKQSASDSGNFSGNSSQEPDLHCDESYDPSWDNESDDSDYNSTPFNDDFFNASPKKNFAIPEPLRLFFRSKTNRRAGKLFMLFTFADSLHLECLKQLHKSGLIKSLYLFEGRTNKDIYCVLIYLHIEMRLLDLKKQIKKVSISNCELFYAVNLLKLFYKLNELYGDAKYKYGEEIKKKEEKEAVFNHKQLVDFALSHNYIEDWKLMYEYAHLADPCDRLDLSTKDHEDDHENERENAIKFQHLSDRQRVCKNAINAVWAAMTYKLHSISNITWLEMRSRELSERLIEVNDCNVFGEAFFYWKYCLTPEFFSKVMGFIISVFTDTLHLNKPKKDKKRYLCIKAPFNCGKTTFAAAVCKFFEGININLNVPPQRLAFYIGAAISKRFVLFDDVKGYRAERNLKLKCGSGISNLDDMREHLDGLIEVQLERKNKNTVDQKFPPGLITMNEYEIPKSLKVRLQIVDFPPSGKFKKHRFSVTMDTIFISAVLDNLIPADAAFISHIHKKKDQWLKLHNSKCNCLVSNLFITMGGVLAAAGAILGEIGAAIAAGASAIAVGATTAAEAAGLIAVDTAVLYTSGLAGEAIPLLTLPAEFAAAGLAEGAAVTYALTGLGTFVVGTLSAGAVIGVGAGLAISLTSRNQVLGGEASLLDALDQLPTLACMLSPDFDGRQCKLYPGSSKRTVRIQPRKGCNGNMCSYAETSHVHRKRLNISNKGRPPAKSRKVSKPVRSMRKSSRR